MVFTPIIFSLNYFKKTTDECSLFRKCSFFEDYFIMFEKAVHSRDKKNLENVYVEKKNTYLIYISTTSVCITTDVVFYTKQGVFGNDL